MGILTAQEKKNPLADQRRIVVAPPLGIAQLLSDKYLLLPGGLDLTYQSPTTDEHVIPWNRLPLGVIYTLVLCRFTTHFTLSMEGPYGIV